MRKLIIGLPLLFFSLPLSAQSFPITGYVQVNPPNSPQPGAFNISSGTVNQLNVTGLPPNQCVQTGPSGLLTVTGTNCSTPVSGGSSALGVTQSGVSVTSPTVALNFFGPPFILAASGSTTTIKLDASSVTLQGNSLLISNMLTQSSATATYLQQSSATANFLTQSSATLTYLQKLDAIGMYLQLSSATANYLNVSSAAATYLQNSSATVTYCHADGTGCTNSNVTLTGDVTGSGIGSIVTAASPNQPNITTFGSSITIKGAGGLTLANVASGLQCLHANNQGQVTGTGIDCGAGGSGSGPTGQINNAFQNAVPVYSVTGSSNVISGSLIATDNGSTFTVTGILSVSSITSASGYQQNGLNILHISGTLNSNTAVGNGALPNNTGFSRNTVEGFGAGAGITTGQSNVAVGYAAMFSPNTSSNTAVGYESGQTAGSSANGNTYLGYVSGKSETGNNNVYLGANTDSLSGNLTNAVAVGANITPSSSNTIILGSNNALILNSATTTIGGVQMFWPSSGTIGNVLAYTSTNTLQWIGQSGGGNFINNQATLQSGATFYVSSGTVDSQLSIGHGNTNNLILTPSNGANNPAITSSGNLDIAITGASGITTYRQGPNLGVPGPSVNMFGNVLISTGALYLKQTTGSPGASYISFVASQAVTTTQFVLPNADGTSGQALITDGLHNLSFGTVSGSGSGGYAVQPATVAFNLAQGVTGSTFSFIGPSQSTVTYGLTVGSMTVNGSGNGNIQLTISGSTFSVTSSSSIATNSAGHMAVWSSTNGTLLDGGVPGSGTPGGSSGQIQYNTGSAFGGIAGTTVTVSSISYSGILQVSTISINGGVSPGAPITIGPNNFSVDPQIMIGRNVDNTGAGAGIFAHAFVDSSKVSRDGTIGYNSYDALAQIAGTGPYDHYVGFQSALNYNSTGTINYIYDFLAQAGFNNTGGPSLHADFYAGNPTIGSSGQPTTQIDFYVPGDPTAGSSQNFGIYSSTKRNHMYGLALGTIDDYYLTHNTPQLVVDADQLDAVVRFYEKNFNTWDVGATSGTANFSIKDQNLTDYLTIQTGGNVGISSTTPGHRLDVKGDMLVTSSTTFNGNLYVSSGVLLGGSAGTSGQVLQSNGAGTVPSWSSGGSGSITSSPQFQVPFYSAAGSSNVISSSANFTNNGTTITMVGIQAISQTNVTTVTASGVLFNYVGSSVTASSMTVSGSALDVNGINYSWPSSQSSNFLKNDGSGNLTWATPTNQSITLSGDSSGSGTTAITVTNASLQNNITTFGSSITINGAGGELAKFGVTATTITISSNTILPGTTIYPDGFGNGYHTMTSSGIFSAMKIIANGVYGTNDQTSGGVIMDFTGGGSTSGLGLQLYTNAGAQTALDAPLYVRIANSAYQEPAVYINSAYASPQSTIRMTSGWPTFTMLDNTQSAPTGKVQMSDHLGIFRLAEIRNAADNAFDSAILVSSAANFNDVAIGLGYNSSTNTLLQVVTSTGNVYAVKVATLPAGPYFVDISTTGHLNAQAVAGSTVTSCGANASLVGSDIAGTITTGAASPTACTLTFARPYTNAPICLCGANGATACDATSTSNTAVTFTLGITETIIKYHCIGID